ncbi:hypothetical protein K9L67_04790 [Candidatus Woesearchaeota archaeon]|nr:hypothetical protein [Candidatus Woesearchaeota archaeon]MCF7901517.1 hypothetical protein [Candidatus Woesearchaeota archaeon]MCF8013932.1 hypothetical protein [Candidatus Woesearchaeota archaeon]
MKDKKMVELIINKLILAAETEDWDYIDKKILEITKKTEYAKWAFKQGIYDKNDNVRDLAVSIIEKSEIPIEKFDEMKNTLIELMKNDKNPYVKFRSAFSFVNHGQGKYDPLIKKTIEIATSDSDVKEIAKEYLSKIN